MHSFEPRNVITQFKHNLGKMGKLSEASLPQSSNKSYSPQLKELTVVRKDQLF